MMTADRNISCMRLGIPLILLGLLATPAFADMYIKIGDIKGESQDKDHKDWIDILSVSQSVSRPTDQSAGGGGRKSVAERSDYIVTKYIDKATPKLAEACCQGTYFPEVNIELTRSGGNKQPYMVYTLKNVVVSSYSVSGAADDDTPPTEEIALNYETIEWKYIEMDAAGRTKEEHISFWDFVLNIFAR